MNEEKAKELLKKYEDGTISAYERALLETWYVQFAKNSADELSPEQLNESVEFLKRQLPLNNSHLSNKSPLGLWTRIGVAASILLMLGTGSYFVLKRESTISQFDNDVAPFTAKVILKTGGKTITLENTANGRIARTNAIKTSGQRLVYQPLVGSKNVIYDTIQVPAGSRPYTVILSDGSELMLNTGTTLRYPETFSKDRKEEIELISGEIYAKIVHNDAAPLQIKAPGQLITDIGTEFNIAAYPDEPDSRTTLVEGAVNVNAHHKEKVLSPGQQTIITAHNLEISTANILQVTAWKDGLFRFNGEHIDVIMRQLSRWYNINVVFEDKLTDEVFYGRVNRKRNISEVLRILERSKKVHFKVEGRRVTVLSN